MVSLMIERKCQYLVLKNAPIFFHIFRSFVSANFVVSVVVVIKYHN